MSTNRMNAMNYLDDGAKKRDIKIMKNNEDVDRPFMAST